MAERYQLVIIGSGPAGLSAGARAAARGLDYVVLERQDRFADTIQKYQRGKFVMATPDVLPLHADSAIAFAAGSREQVLDSWDQTIKGQEVRLRYGAEVARIEGQRGAFTITLRDGSAIEADQVVLAIGVQGNLRKLEVPGADLPLVQYQLDDPDEYAGETIVVVGAGDAAIENAVALAKQNRVIIVNRRAEFARAKTGNLNAIEKAIESGRIECVYNAAPERIEPDAIHLRTPDGTRSWRCDRIIARLGADPPRRFLEACGIAFAGSSALYPEVSVTYETNVPGLYAVGALAGYPLIKHCINQGYEVAETIAGHAVVPADEPLMQAKLAGMPGRPSVAEALQEIKAKVPLFQGLTTLQLREFLLDSEVHVPAAGELIFERNGFGNTLFCIVSGTVQFELADDRNPDAPPRLAYSSEGDFFGEAGLVAGRRRAGTARAKTDCVLVELARRSAIKLLNSVPAARELFERTTIVRQLQRDLSAALTEADLERVLASAEIKQFPTGAKLIEEGAPDDRSVYLIRSGSVTVARKIDGKDVVLAYRPVGHIVGEMALLRKAPRRATVSAAIATETICIDGALFEELLEERPDLRATIEAVVLQKVAEEPGRERHQTWGGVTEFLVAQGAGEATDILLIDESLVHPLRQLREGLRREPRRHLAPRSRGRTDLRDGPRADLVPALRASALHGRLPARRAPPRRERRGLDRRHLHRLRQLRRELSLWRDPDGVAAAAQARPAGMAAVRVRPRPGRRPALPRARGRERRSCRPDPEGRGQVRHVHRDRRRPGLRARLPDRRRDPGQPDGNFSRR